jgi:large subunit ribosomal protein L17
MSAIRKLGRATDQRKAILKNQVTSLIENGRIETTQARAMEVKNIAEKIISLAVAEVDNFTSRNEKKSSVELDSKGRKMTKNVTSRNGNKYTVVERTIKDELVRVDAPSRLNARRKALKWLYRVKDKDGNNVNLANKLFDEIAPKFKGVNGGYTRIYKIGQRRGDAAEMVILELTK